MKITTPKKLIKDIKDNANIIKQWLPTLAKAAHIYPVVFEKLNKATEIILTNCDKLEEAIQKKDD